MGTLKTAIMQSVSIAGLLAVAIVAPNALKAIPPVIRKQLFSAKRNARDVAVSRLVSDGMLAREQHNGTRVLRITNKGSRYLAELSQYRPVRHKNWDGRWRVVIFDIAESRKNLRDLLRRELLTAGFIKLQNSVWAYPYPCEELVALLKANSHIGKDVLYLVVEEMENDQALRSHFDLRLQ